MVRFTGTLAKIPLCLGSLSLFSETDLSLSLANVPLKFLTLKTVFIITLASGKRLSEVHTLFHSRVSRDKNWSYVSLEPSSRFIAKNQIARNSVNILQPIIINSLSSTLSEELKDDRLLCPVRALSYYLERMKDIRGD
jgi:hypothetical protein